MRPAGPPAVFTPGPATLRRLTVAQYGATLRDLVGSAAAVPGDLEEDVPLDGLVAVGTARLSFSARATEQFENVALDLSQRAMTEATTRVRMVTCSPSAAVDEDCARSFVTGFGRRAWRRPLVPEEIGRYTAIAAQAARLTGDFWRGLAWAMAGLLQSPYFLYRVELGTPDPADPGRRRLEGHETASRLSYLLWDTTPDDTLLAAADANQLETADGLRRQAERLLGAPQAAVGLRRFFSDRLRLDDLADADHPTATFPLLTPTMMDSMQRETLALVDDLVTGRDADVRELLDSHDAFLNDELAALYGLPKPGKKLELVRTRLPAGLRAGYLGQGSFLALNAHQNATSPTRRGKFIREVLLCQSMPPPPPDANPVLPEETGPPRPLRARLESHRQDPACAGCHALMDPIGLAFENFDAVGSPRASDMGTRIDASGQLDGAAFTDGATLAAILRTRPEVADCLVRGVFRYATGHVETDGEEAAIAAVGKTFSQSGYRFRSLLKAVVDSPGFRQASLEAP